MDNRAIVEKVFQFEAKIRPTNPGLARALSEATIGLLSHRGDLSRATRERLLGIAGVGPKSVDYLVRLLRGEAIESVSKDVPVAPRASRRAPAERPPRNRTEWDGSWDDAVARLEGDRR